ncbi:MAG: class I SAM-dependent methyltransferase [Myxococcota bacterium]
MSQEYRLYGELASWWSVMRPPEHYADEAQIYFALLQQAADAPIHSVLELGSGGGQLASQLPHHLEIILNDASAAMLEVSRSIHPGRRHVQGRMQDLELGRTVDAILLHDAVMYLTRPEDLRTVLERMFFHCRPGGAILIVPDVVEETFEEFSTGGGQMAEDGRALQMLEWHWDPRPGDGTYQVDFAFLLRSPDGVVKSVHEQHTMALRSFQTYLKTIQDAGFQPVAVEDILTLESPVFLARRP